MEGVVMDPRKSLNTRKTFDNQIISTNYILINFFRICYLRGNQIATKNKYFTYYQVNIVKHVENSENKDNIYHES